MSKIPQFLAPLNSSSASLTSINNLRPTEYASSISLLSFIKSSISLSIFDNFSLTSLSPYVLIKLTFSLINSLYSSSQLPNEINLFFSFAKSSFNIFILDNNSSYFNLASKYSFSSFSSLSSLLFNKVAIIFDIEILLSLSTSLFSFICCLSKLYNFSSFNFTFSSNLNISSSNIFFKVTSFLSF